MQSNLEERDWKRLLKQITKGRCTPILGPGVSENVVPLRDEIAKNWAAEYSYPLADSADLARVAQFLSVQNGPLYPKDLIQEQIEEIDQPNFTDPKQPHGALADLNLPIYLTTNYDGFMFEALRHRRKDPQREICRWNEVLQRQHISVLESDFSPTPAQPLVYHIHGHHEYPESLVLTEDDYLDFLVNISGESYRLPPRIQQSFTNASLLFLGYNPIDWDFRVLLRGLVATSEANMRRISVTVQLAPLPEDTPEKVHNQVQSFLNNYFGRVDDQMRIYWGTAQEFINELSARWQGNQVKERDEVRELANASRLDPRKILRNLMEYFNLEELRGLAFDLRIDEGLFPERKEPFARELITYLQRRQRLNELIEVGRKWRPKVDW